MFKTINKNILFIRKNKQKENVKKFKSDIVRENKL